MGSYLNRQILRIVWIVLLFIGYQAATAFLSTASSLAGTNPDLAAKYIGLTLIASALLLWLFHWLYQKQLAKNNPRHFAATTSKRLCSLFCYCNHVWYSTSLVAADCSSLPHHQIKSWLIKVSCSFLWNTIYDCMRHPTLRKQSSGASF